MTELRALMKSKGLMFISQAAKMFGTNGKVLDLAIFKGQLKCYSLPLSLKNFVKPKEVKEFLKKKVVKINEVKINTRCKKCGRFFSYIRLLECSKFSLGTVKKNTTRRQYCDDCVNTISAFRGPHTEEAKKKLSESMKNCWANCDPEAKQQRCNNMSVGRALAWSTSSGRERRKKMSEVLSKIAQQFWDDNEDLKKEFGEKVEEFWYENPEATTEQSIRMKKMWEEIKK